MPKKVIMKTDLAPQIIKYVQFMREKIGRGFVTEEQNRTTPFPGWLRKVLHVWKRGLSSAGKTLSASA